MSRSSHFYKFCIGYCLHSNGIIHRDLKLGNLLLTEDQKRIKLGDFGLAREETVNEMMSSEVGTPQWMAPELYSSVTLLHGEKKHYDLLTSTVFPLSCGSCSQTLLHLKGCQVYKQHMLLLRISEGNGDFKKFL